MRQKSHPLLFQPRLTIRLPQVYLDFAKANDINLSKLMRQVIREKYSAEFAEYARDIEIDGIGIVEYAEQRGMGLVNG